MVDPTSDDAELSAQDEYEDEGEGGGESTVAMQSPSFDPSIPSPVSIPPPGGAPPPMIPTAPVGFPPPGGAPGFAPSEPAKAVGMTAQSPAVPAGIFARPKRAQTVIGIAPPGQGAQRPPNPALAAPAQTSRPASVPRTVVVAALHDDDDGPVSETATDMKVEAKAPPTLASNAKTPDPMFGLDEAAGEAARAAVRPNMRHSPLASTGFTANGGVVKSAAATRMEKPSPPWSPRDQESTTTAFVDDLGLPPTRAAGALPQLHDIGDGDDESTRAVPREELLRSQDAHLVVGDDVGGDDATLAVAPGMNDAALQRLGLGSAQGRSPLGAEASGGHPSPFFGSANPTQQSAQYPMGPPPSWNHAAAMPPSSMQHATSQIPSSTSAMPMLAPYPQQQQQGYPAPHAGMHPGMQGGPPGPPGTGYPNGAWPQGWPGPQSGQQLTLGQPPGQNPGQLASQNPGHLGPRGEPRKKFPLSGQVIALGLIGVVCLAIFVTGVVLFFTTKF